MKIRLLLVIAGIIFSLYGAYSVAINGNQNTSFVVRYMIGLFIFMGLITLIFLLIELAIRYIKGKL